MKRNGLRREPGSGANIILLLTLFVFFLMFLSIMQMGYQKVKFIKYRVEDAVHLSARAATVTDFYEYATYERLLLDCSGLGTDLFGELSGVNSSVQYDSNIYDATKKAYGFSFDRFKEAMEENLNASWSGEQWRCELEDFIIYNVYNEDVYVSENTSNCIFYSEQKGNMKTPNDVRIYNSGVYVKMTLTVHFMTIMGHSYDYDISIEDFIDLADDNPLE